MSSHLYTLLELSPQATRGEIRAAYLRLASQHHPDRNAGDARAAERFRQIQSAYETLGNVERRTIYDSQIGSAPTAPVIYPSAAATPSPVPRAPASAAIRSPMFARCVAGRGRARRAVVLATAATLLVSLGIQVARRDRLLVRSDGASIDRVSCVSSLAASSAARTLERWEHRPSFAASAEEAFARDESSGQVTLAAIAEVTGDAPTPPAARSSVTTGGENVTRLTPSESAASSTGSEPQGRGEFFLSLHEGTVRRDDLDMRTAIPFPDSQLLLADGICLSQAVDLASMEWHETRLPELSGTLPEWPKDGDAFERQRSLDDLGHPWAAIEPIVGWRDQMKEPYLQKTLPAAVTGSGRSPLPLLRTAWTELRGEFSWPADRDVVAPAKPPIRARSVAISSLPAKMSRRGDVSFVTGTAGGMVPAPAMGAARPVVHPAVRSSLDILQWRRRPAGEL